MPLEGFDYDDLFNEETPGESTDKLSIPTFEAYEESRDAPEYQPEPAQEQPEPEAEPEPPPEPPPETRKKLGQVKGYDSIDEYDRETETYGLADWEDVVAARAEQERKQFLKDNPRPKTWIDKVAQSVGRTSDELAASAMELSAGIGDAPATYGLELMYRAGLVTEEDYQDATSTKEAAEAYRDRFKEAAENAPWWNPLQRFIGLMAVSSEEKGELRRGAQRYWQEAEKHPVSQDVIDLEESESLDELFSPTWYLERLGPEAARMGIAAAVTASSRSPMAGAAVMGGDVYGRKLQSSMQWLEQHRKDLNYGEREALAQGMAAQAAFTEYITEKIPLGILFSKRKGGGLVSKNGVANRISDFLSKTRLGRRAMAATMRGTNVLDNLVDPALRLAGVAGAEAIQEPVAGFTERFTEYMLGDEDALQGNVKQMIVEAVGGAAIGGGIGGVSLAPQVAQEFTEGATKNRQRRIEAMRRNANNIASTPEGLTKLQELADKELPSRKDFVDAGFHRDAIGNAQERANLVNQFRPEVLQQVADAKAAAEAHEQRGAVVEQPQVLAQPVEGAPALQQLKEKSDQIISSGRQIAGPQLVRKMQQEKKQLSQNIAKTYKLKRNMADAVAEVVQSTLTPEEVAQISFERGGKPGDSALYQIAETVERIQNDPEFNPTGNEKVFFGKILPQHWEATKKELKETSGLALTKQAQALRDAKGNIKDHGEAFEKHFNKRGTKKILERAVTDYAKFIKDNPEYEQYYETEVVKEREQLVRQYPELSEDANFHFYRMINGIASAQTELGKNTEETIAAYGGFRQTGRIPVVIGTRKGKVLKSGERQIKDAPVYAIPANKRPITGTEAADAATAHEFDVTMQSDVDNVVAVMKELDQIIPQEVLEILSNEDAEIPSGLKMLTPGNRSKFVKTQKEYLYDWAAPKYITSDIAKRANTTSKPLVMKMYIEWKGYDPATQEEEFRTRTRTAFEIGGGSSQYNKARNYKVLNGLLAQDQFKNEDGTPNLPALIEWLNERVPFKQLSEERKEMGFGAMGNKADIEDTVWTAEGQQDLIPRTFIFGPKVGAYMLNRMADAHPKNADYNTMDVWESRFWRGFNNDLGDTEFGIASGTPRKVYMRQAREFVKEYEKQTGKPLKVSAGQAGRWYLMKTAMAEAGYLKAGRDETIAGFTGELVDRYARQQLNQMQPEAPDVEAALLREYGGDEDIREAFDLDPEEVGFQRRVETLGGPEGQGGLVNILFQRTGEQILGSMEKLPGGEILLRGFQNSDTDTAVEELAHGIRNLVLRWDVPASQRGISDQQLYELEEWAHEGDSGYVPGQEWTVEAEERFAQALRKYLQQGTAPVSRLQKAFNAIGRALTKIYKLVSRRPNITVPDNINAMFDQLVTRREKLIEAQYNAEKPAWDAVRSLPGRPKKGWVDPLPVAHAAKAAYLKDKGMPNRRQAELVKVDEAFAKRIADAYERAEHNPNDPEVQAAYAAMAQETLDQWEYVKATGLQVEPMPPGVDPYNSRVEEIVKDIKENNHFWFFPTTDGFGTQTEADADHPLLAKTGEKVGDYELLVNDIFRIVHDYFGHGLEGVSTFARGEENAWQAHVRMYSPLAARAMTAETRGQNSWVNFGPHAEHNKTASAADTIYADQKMTLLPKWVSEANITEDALESRTPELLDKAKADGGFTFDPNSGTYVTEGWAFAPSKDTEFKVPLEEATPQDIADYAKKWEKELNKPGRNLGAWIEDGQLWMDIAQVGTLDEASKAGAAADQEAIFDLGTGNYKYLNRETGEYVDEVPQKADDRPEGLEKLEARPDEANEPAPSRRGIGRRRVVRVAPAAEGTQEVEAFERAPLPSEEREADAQRTTAISEATKPIGRGESAWSRNQKGDLKAKPISKREAVRNILDRIGLTAVENFKGIAPTAVGYYKKARLGLGQGGVGLAIRRKELADIGVAVHEATHYYDDKLGITDLNRPITESAAKNLDPGEMVALANESYQPQGQRTFKEGFAEAVRLMVMVENPKSAFRSSMAYDVANKLIEAPGNEELKQFIQDSRKDVEQYMAQSDAEKISRAMVRERAPIIDPSESYFARNARGRYHINAALRFLERKLVNDRRDATVAANEVERRFKEFWNSHSKETGISADKAWAQIVRDSGGRFDQKLLQHSNFTRARTEQLVIGTDANPGAIDIFKDFTQKEVDDFGRYMYAQVSLQRMKRDPDYQPGEVDAEVLEAFVAENKSDKFDEAARQVTDYFNGLLKQMEDAELITDVDVDRMTKAHELYMPFYRQFADENYSAYGGQFVNVKPPLKKLKGGSVMPVLDVYDAMVKRTGEVVGAINRKNIENSMVDMMQKSGVADEFLRVTNGPGPGVIRRVENGVEAFYQIDPDLRDAMGRLGNPAANNLFLQVFNKIARLPRNLMVNWNPLFAARNFPRDYKTAQVKGLMDLTGVEDANYTVTLMTEPWREVVRTAKQELGMIDKSDSEKLYEELGGRLDRKMESVMADRGVLGTKRRRKIGKQEETVVDHTLKILKHGILLNEATELAPRKVAFTETLRLLGEESGEFSVDSKGDITGEVPEWAYTQAMSNAQEITVNFNRRGAWAPFIEPFTLYFNAAMQGSVQSRGQVLGDPQARKRLVIATSLAATAHLLGLAAMAMWPSPDDEDKSLLDHYWEIPEYYRKSQSVFIAPGGVAIGIPREREWGPIQRLIEETARAAFGPEEFAPKELVWNELKDTMAESVAVTGGTIPTLGQLYLNYNIHYGEPIESEWDRKKYITQRYDSRTLTASKFLSQNLLHNEIFFEGMSPQETDFLLRNMGFGSLAALYDAGWAKPGDKAPFMVDEKPRQSINDFYVKSEELAQKVQGIEAGVEFKDEAKIKTDHAAFALASSVMKKIRQAEIDDDVKAKFLAGTARWALGRPDDSLYPNPLFNQEGLPPKIAADIRKSLARKRKEVKGEAKKRFRKPGPTK